MQPEVMITFLGGLFGIGAIILAGQWIRQKGLHGRDLDALHRLTESLDGLHERVGAMEEKMLTLDQRLEFTERLLTAARAREEREQHESPNR